MSKRKIHKYIEKNLIEMVMEMGAESLNPDQYSQLEEIKDQLMEIRHLSDTDKQTVGADGMPDVLCSKCKCAIKDETG